MKKLQRLANQKQRRLHNLEGRKANLLYPPLRMKLPPKLAPVVTAPLPIPAAPVRKRGFWSRLFNHTP